jgi:rhodanese-related sulfurtransferase
VLLRHTSARVALSRAAAAAALIAVALVVAGSFAVGLDPSDPRVTLGDVERQVSAKFPVTEVSVPELAQTMATGNVVLFDVRTREEFDQSHIEGAIWVDPDMSAASFAKLHGQRVRGKAAVFYCAVGVRSGVMVQRVSQSLASFGPTATLNLKGGAFRWHAQQRPLMSTAGPVRAVHPYDEAWGKLLDRTLKAEETVSR